jgi:quercetin dioxygenase-like cupin family protein
MKRNRSWLGVVLGFGVVLGAVGERALQAQDPLKTGKVLQRTELVGTAKGLDGLLVLRELPAGAESGKHTQAGNEIVYILEGQVTLEVQGKAPQVLKAGEAFQTVAGEVHNVKNSNPGGGSKALAFYVAKKGAGLEDLSSPVK